METGAETGGGPETGPVTRARKPGTPPDALHIPGTLLLLSGIFFLLLALIYNELLLELLDPDPPLAAITVHRIRWTEFLLAVSGLAGVLLAFLVRRIAAWSRFTNRKLVSSLLLSGMSLLVPLLSLELCLRPFARFEETTTIFMKDDDLGWKMKPGARDVWGGVRVEINAKGLRGPAVEYQKSAGGLRILYLGDSVTFGYMLPSYKQTFPFLVGQRLEERLKMPVETVNAGVDGYSPWQEHRFLVREGIRYHPDLVVVGFVLNDVTEKLELTRFGGWSEGPQLARTVSGSLERVLKRSSLLQFGGRLFARMRFGTDVRSGALKKELLDVESLATHPDRPDVQRAWRGALADLGEIFSFCRNERVSVIVVVFPYTFQFMDPVALRAPQERVMRLARDERVPALDLLPALADRMKEADQRPGDYFLDINHLSPQGSEVVSELLANFIGRVLEADGEDLRGGS